MKLSGSVARAVLLAGLFSVSCAQGQTLYRCGSVYQDKPCADGGGKKLPPVSGSTPAGAEIEGDVQCRQRGEQAQKIVWAREAGQIEEQMLARSANPAEQQLVREVYAQRGTLQQIKRAIVTACMDEKKRQAPPPLTKTEAKADTRPPSKPEEKTQAKPEPKQESAARQCAQARAQLDALKKQAPAGQLEALEAELKKNGC
ncbi:hypothetical protein V8J88_11155 [Massilia sp. W12]|uniref:hypothetical protein n=1 Tax=Massilia sp. W12 TaxID=3126507 RepID=UPI0030D1B5C5